MTAETSLADTEPRWDGTEQIVAYVQPGCGIFIAPLG